MPLDHVGLAVPKDKFDLCVEFYEKTLAPLGYETVMKFPGVVGMGVKPSADFWIAVEKEEGKAGGGLHLAFATKSHDVIQAFHKAAIDAGGKDNGAPGPRPQYHPNYYGAFILDPVGNNIEAVCHTPQ